MSRQIGARKRPKFRAYDDESLRTAMSAVMDGRMTLGEASRAYGIPKSTLSDKKNGRTQLLTRQGPTTVLTTEEEEGLAKWIADMQIIGYGRTKQDVEDIVKKILDEDGRPNVLRNNTPGKDWWAGFLRRHTAISLRSTQQLEKERAMVSPYKIDGWFERFEKYLDDIIAQTNDAGLLLDPSRWYNADESGFPLNPKTGKVLASRDSSHVYSFSSSDKTQLTVLACCSANGHYVPPYIVYPGQRFGYNPLEEFQEAFMGKSESGWMNSALFSKWLEMVFIPSVDARMVKKPLVLLVDGHKTHLSMTASKLADDNGIILYCLPSHASHVMQPLDLVLFHSLKSSWKEAVRHFQSEHIGDTVTKERFGKVFKQAWQKSSTPENAIKGFREAGLFPLDKSVILSSSKLKPSSVLLSPQQRHLHPSAVHVKNLESACETQTNSDKENTPQGSQIDNLPVRSYLSLLESIENIIGEEKKQLYVKRFSEHYDAPDELYELWKRLRSKSESIRDKKATPTAEALQFPSCSSTNVSVGFQKHLKIPEVQTENKRKTKRVKLPDAISGQEFRDIQIRIINEQKQAEADKEKRKQEREEKRKLKQEAEDEKEKRKQDREEKRKLKQEEKERKEKEKQDRTCTKKGKHQAVKLKYSESPDPSDDEIVYADSDSVSEFDPTSCFRCDGMIGDDMSSVSCMKCNRRFHRCCCPEIDDEEDGTDDSVYVLFECDYC